MNILNYRSDAEKVLKKRKSTKHLKKLTNILVRRFLLKIQASSLTVVSLRFKMMTEIGESFLFQKPNIRGKILKILSMDILWAKTMTKI